MKRTFAVLLISIVLFVAVKGLLIVLNKTNSSDGSPSVPSNSAEPAGGSSETSETTVQPVSDQALKTEEYAVTQLQKHGWTEDAAKAVFEVNADYFARLDSVDRQMLDSELERLYRLDASEIQSGLARHPEYATLFCSVLDVDTDGAASILQTLPLDEELQMHIAFLYQINAAPEDAIATARLLQNPEWQNRIVELIRKSPANIEMLRYFKVVQRFQDESPLAAETYEHWLLEILDEYQGVESDSDRAAELLVFLQIYTEPLIREFKRDESFCNAFPECWHMFENLLNSLDRSAEDYELWWACYCQDTNVFRFLYEYRDDHAEELYKKYGVAGTEILMSRTFLNPEAREGRERLVQLMLREDEMLSQAIIVSRPHLCLEMPKLLARGLSDDLYRAMFCQMASTGATSSLASKWNRLSDNALEKELGLYEPGFKQFIPGYDVYCLCEKAVQGRDISGWDIAFAGVDAAFIVVDVATIGGSKAVTSTLSTAGKGAKIVAKGGKAAIKGAVKLSAKEVKQSALLTVRLLRQANQFIAQQMSRLTNMDISQFLRSVFQKSGIKNQTFKKWTGMDARIFMRQDRKVLLHLGNIPATKTGKLARNVLCDTAVACGFVAAAQTDTGQAVIQRGKEAIDAMRPWKQNLSMWWRLNQNE